MNEKWRLFAIMILTYDDSDIQINGKHYELKKEYVFRKKSAVYQLLSIIDLS